MNAAELVARATGPAIATDEADRLLQWNGAARELLGYDRDRRCNGLELHELIEVRDVFGNRVEAEGPAFFEMVSHGEPINDYELSVRRATGERVLITVSVVVVLGPTSGRRELVYLLRPVLRRRKADEAIARLLAGDEGPGAASGGVRQPDPYRSGGSGGAPELTRRQLAVLRLLADGHSNAEIARLLGVSVNTVRSHVQILLQRLGARTRAEALARAFRDRLL